jgi:SAM-dependent methyltransferase
MSGLSELKQKQRATWALGEYDRIADGLTISTDQTLRVARVRPGERVLDLATGTGITAIAARERGAIVTAVDLTPQLFIALSINLTHILRLPGVSARAGEAILILMTMLIGSLVALLPNLAPIQLGVAFLALGLATWGVPTALQLRAFARGHYHRSSFAIWLPATSTSDRSIDAGGVVSLRLFCWWPALVCGRGNLIVNGHSE